MEKPTVERKGKYFYDYLVFKIENVEYYRSIELENLLIDLNKKGRLSGIRIFDPSKIFGISKKRLDNVGDFRFHIKIKKNILTLELEFKFMEKKRSVTEHGVMKEILDSNIAETEVVCSVA